MTDDQKMKKFIDERIQQLAQRMIAEGFPTDMVLDRFWTFSVAQTCNINGAFETVNLLKNISEQVQAGKFAALEPRGTSN